MHTFSPPLNSVHFKEIIFGGRLVIFDCILLVTTKLFVYKALILCLYISGFHDAADYAAG